MTGSKKRDNSGLAARLDIVSRSFNRRRDALTIYAIVSRCFFDGGQPVPFDLEETIIGNASDTWQVFEQFSKLFVSPTVLFFKNTVFKNAFFFFHPTSNISNY